MLKKFPRVKLVRGPVGLIWVKVPKPCFRGGPEMQEVLACYIIQKNEIRMYSGFSPRQKSLALSHEFAHYAFHLLPDHTDKLDEWLDCLSLKIQKKFRWLSLQIA